MQTTLLGLAVAMILALLAALVGPHFVDWDGWRETFEAEAGRAVGAPVRIDGPIAVRILPTPSLDLNGVALAAGGTRLSARALRVELALGPLMRGEWRVAELAVDAPQLDLALDGAGRTGAPALPAGFDTERLSIDRLVIENGRAVLSDAASGGSVTLDSITFKGDLRSLAGPLRGEGAFVIGGTLYGVRVGTGRQAQDGSVRVRLNVDPLDRPLMIETDGTLWLGGGAPRFEGALTLARPAGTAGAGLGPRRAVAHEPWRLTGRVEATGSRGRLAQAEFQYGPDDRALRLAGAADLVLGRFPRLDLTVSGRQLDLDRIAGPARPDRRPPEALQEGLHSLVASLRPPLPVRATLDIDSLNLGGGAALLTVRGTVATGTAASPDGVTLDGIELRAPGLTQMRLSGTLTAAGPDLAFAGPVSLDSGDPRALSAFLEGRSDASSKDAAAKDGAQKPMGTLRARGDITLDRDRLAVEGLSVEIDRKAVEGRFAYTRPAAGRPARLDATLKAAEIDIEGATALVTGALSGTQAEWPREATLAVTAGKAVWGRVVADRVDARLGYDGQGLTIDRLVVGDLRGASLDASGRIDTSITAPQGAVTLLLKAPRSDALVALAGELAPDQAATLRRYASSLGAAELRAKLEVAPASAEPAAAGGPARSAARLTVDGRFGAMRLVVSASGTGDPAAPQAAQVRFDGTVEAKESAALAALTGLDRLVTLDGRPATVSLSGSGRLDGEVEAKLDIASGGLWVAATGKGRRDGAGFSGRADVSVTASDAKVLAAAAAGPSPLPVSLKARVALSPTDVRLDDLAGRIAGATLTGHLGVTLSEPRAVAGRIETSDLDAVPVLLALTGATRRPVPREGATPTTDAWSAEPFGRPAFADLHGRVEIEAGRASLLPNLVARDLKAVARLDGGAIALDGLKAQLADGALSADAELRLVPAGLALHARLALSGADLAKLVPGSGKTPPAEGRVSLSVDLDGAGLSPAALVGALSGSGAATVEGAQLSGLDPAAVDAGVRAVERGLPLERLSGYLGTALDAGRLTVRKAGGALSVTDGRVRLGPMEATVEGTTVALTAGLDLGTETLDARFTMAAPARDDGPGGRRPELAVTLRGPLAAPRRAVDTAALVTWVTLRSVEQEAKRVEAAEREAKRRDAVAAAERARLDKERLDKERLARDAAAREAASREATVRAAAEQERLARERAAAALPRPEPDPMPTAATRPAEAAPALPPPIEIRPQPVRPAAAAAAAPPKPPASAQAQPQPEAPSPVRSLMQQLFNFQ